MRVLEEVELVCTAELHPHLLATSRLQGGRL